MKEFAYQRATEVRDALVAANGGARYLGGGTNLVDLMKNGVEAPTRLVDVRFLPLDGVSEAPDGGLVIGATTTNSWSRHCAATHPSDMAVAMAAFDAVVRYETLDGAGEIPLSEFYPPVGDTPERETALPPGALITAVVLPGSAVSPWSRYRKVRERASYAFANVSIAAGLDVHDGLVRSARIALGGVASRPWRARTAEDLLREGPATPDRFRAAADAELSAAEPLPHNGYKVTLARNLIVAVLTELAEETRA
ncbi:hypothetical protein Aple_021330 [Acrocarpospora pleiomorpha]|uniref:CO dehydrogenase flavoprotein C-terminal domain-containing protein n=1 Tax=Acrocarpospora pleiomorpha TaxID=90975 RepID=A0A5M3XC37_9ACTN|nr:FAD binding domain-containing protein [Acrocarpospora pleiomorpha]GES19237.1 hypothetical protein Aple_021330 [Acrocarpospora pleiomorpha]